MGILDRIEHFNLRKPLNILGLFALLAGLFFGAWTLFGRTDKLVTITALSPADYARISDPITRRQDSLFAVREASSRRLSDSNLRVLFHRDSAHRFFQLLQPIRDEKYQTTLTAADSVLYRQWQARYGAN